ARARLRATPSRPDRPPVVPPVGAGAHPRRWAPPVPLPAADRGPTPHHRIAAPDLARVSPRGKRFAARRCEHLPGGQAPPCSDSGGIPPDSAPALRLAMHRRAAGARIPARSEERRGGEEGGALGARVG